MNTVRSLAMFDNEMKYLVASQKWSDDFNLGPESLLGKSHYDIFPAMKQWWKDLHERALNGEIIVGNEDTFVRNDGKLEWKRWDLYPWYDVNEKIGGIIIFSQIITEQKKAQQKLLIHDALLSRSEQMGKFGCWETDFLIDRTECSDAYYALTGLPKEEQTSLVKFRALVHPDDRDNFEKDIKAIYKKPGVYSHNFRIITSDGVTRYIHSSLEVYFSSDNKLLRAFGVMQDVTEQHQYEESLRTSEEKYRMLFDQADDGIAISSREGKFIQANTAFCNIFGITTAEIVNYRLEDFIVIAEKEEPLRYKELLNNIKVDSTRNARTRDGKNIIISISAKMMPNGLFLGFCRDITEKIESARAIQESENKFRAIFESEPECVKVMDADCNLISMNPAGITMLGANSLEEIKGRCIAEVVLPKYRDEYKKMAKEVFKGKSVKFDFEIITFLGLHKIFESQSVPLRNAAGEVISVLSVSLDVTDKRKAAEKLAASEARFRSIIEQFPFPVANYHTNGDLFSINKAWEILWQSQREDFEGYNMLKDPLVVEAGLMEDAHRAFGGELMQSKPFLYEPSRIGNTGRSRWIIPTMFPLKTTDGEILEVIEILQDVTDQIEAKAEMEASEEKYRTLVEEANDGIFIADKSGKFIVVNPSGCRMSQYSFEELKDMSLYDLVLPEDLKKRPFRFAEMHEGKIVHSERRMKRKDGSIVDVELSAKFITETRFLAFVRDITESKKAQNEIRKSNDRFNLIANATNDALYEWNLDTNEIWWSESHFLMFGFDPHKPIPSQEEWLSKIHPDDRHLLIEQLDDALNRKAINSSAIVRYLTAEDTYGTLLQRCTLTRIDESSKGTVVGSFVDITSRIKVEEELRLMEKAIATSISGMGLADLTGKITYANDTLWKMWGFNNREELLGKHLTEVFHGNRIDETIHNLQVRGYDHGEDIGLKADNSLFNVAFSANIITDQKGAPICLFGSFIDITDRKKAEDAIRQSESKYRLLFDLSPLPKFVFDENTFNILDVNNATVDHYGYSREELLNMKVEEIIAPEDREKFPKAIIEGKAIKKGGLWNHLTKNEKVMQVEIFTHKLQYNDQPAWLVLANDVSKEIEQKELLEQTTSQLRQLAAHLQDIREEERTNIAREIHDEMGQQLTALKIDLSYVKKKCDPNDTATMTRIESAMSQVDETIKSIRRISTDLHPGILEDLGLVAALEWQAQEFEIRTGIKTDFIDHSSEKSIDKNISRAIFRIFQESLTNIARHSGAKMLRPCLRSINMN
ncbi:MAG: PAS domain S-box protein [Bacteroidetes bacterium]|nr:PAS domain S-box protein [Bacteroidota bacterium]